MSNPWEAGFVPEEVDAVTMAAPKEQAPKKPWMQDFVQEPTREARGRIQEPTPTPEQDSPRRQVFNQITEVGFSPVAAAGLLANVEVETGGTFSHEQRQIRGPAYGLFQLDPTGPMYNDYFSYLEETGTEDSSLAQIQYVRETIYGDRQDIIGRGNASKLRTALEGTDPVKAAKSFMEIWERPGVPHWERRKKAAERNRDLITQATVGR